MLTNQHDDSHYIFLWQLVWSKFSMLPGTAATHVGVICLYNQNMNVIIYTHTALTPYPGGLLPLRSPCGVWGQLPLHSASRTGNEFILGFWPILELETLPVQPQTEEKSGFLKHLCCIFLTLLVLVIPAPSQKRHIKAGIGFRVFRNLIA